MQRHEGYKAGRKSRSAVAGSLAGLAMMLGLFGLPACAAETGVRGTVLWGPVHPGPEHHGTDTEAPLSAGFTVLGSGRRIARFQSDEAGKFQQALPPGQYILVPEANTAIPNPRQQTTEVTVPTDGYTDITIRLNTGMK